MSETSLSIERLCAPDASAVISPLLREYVPWVTSRLAADYGIVFEDVEDFHERQHRSVDAEMGLLLGPRGRVLLARLDGEPVGVCVLKPVHGDTGEIKRLYVRPQGRGRSVGRALLTRLLADARAEGYAKLRLESLRFMTEAQSLYRSLGFVDTPAFEHSQGGAAGLADITRYMEKKLG